MERKELHRDHGNGHGNANVYEDALELRPDQRVLGL